MFKFCIGLMPAIGRTLLLALATVLVAWVGNGPGISWDFRSGVLPPRMTFTRASTKSCFNSSGSLVSLAVNVPCFDYDPVTHVPKGLYAEPQTTNLFLTSGTPANQTITVTNNTYYTVSFYGTGSIAYTGAATGTLTGSGAFPARASVIITSTTTSLVLVVTGSVVDPQVEAGRGASSYIPTTASTATRAGDLATMPVGSWWNTQTGMIRFGMIFHGAVGAPVGGQTFSTFYTFIGTVPNNNNYKVRLGSWPTNQNLAASFVYNSLGDVAAGGASSMVTDSQTDIATWYGPANQYIASNGANLQGGLVIPNVTGLLPRPITLQIGGTLNSQVVAEVWLSYFDYYPRFASRGEISKASQ